MLHIAALANNESIAYNTYKYIDSIELFSSIANETMNTSNATMYANWIASLNASAAYDGLSLSVQNKSIEVYTHTKPEIVSLSELPRPYGRGFCHVR